MRKSVCFVLFILTVLFSFQAFSAQVFKSSYHWSNRGSGDSIEYGRDCTNFLIILEDGESLDLAAELLNEQDCCCGMIGVMDILNENPWAVWPSNTSQLVFFIGCLPDGHGIRMMM